MVGIDRIVVRDFRGLGGEHVLDLRHGEIHGAGLVLLGENGTGKSSFVEAIEFGLTGRVSSLVGRGQRIGQKHATHVRGARPSVELVLFHGGRRISVGPDTDPQNLPEPFRTYVQGARSGTFTLRRARMLDFIEAGDADRYQALLPFLDLDDFVRAEEVLKKAKQKAEEPLREAEQRARVLEDDRSRRVGKATVDDWLNDSFELAGLPRATRDEWPDRRKALQARLSDDRTTRLRERVRFRIADVQRAWLSGEGLRRAIEQLRRRDALEAHGAEVLFERVLTDGARWLDQSPATCPLCEQSVNHDRVAHRIHERLTASQMVIRARRDAHHAAHDARTEIEQLLRTLAELQAAWSDSWPDRPWPWETFEKQLREIVALTRQDPVDTRAFEAAVARLDLDAAGSALESLAGEVPAAPPSHVAVAHERVSWAEEWATKHAEAERVKGAAATLAEKAAALHQAAIDARRAACEEILAEIDDDVRSIYARFHPDEPLGNLALRVTQRGSGSARLDADFVDQTGVDPRAYSSEGHLDTLGLAVFLALHERQRAAHPGFDLLVLDDVLGTVDNAHRERIASVLHGYAREQQVVLTTHSRQWYEWLVHLQRNDKVEHRFVNRRILSWTLERGPVIADLGNDLDRLQRRRADPLVPAEDLVQPAGRVLETILAELRINFALAVPAQPGDRYTLAHLWKPFRAAVRDRYPGLWAEIGSICDQIDRSEPIRNWGTHANTWADLTRDECLSFVDPVIALALATRCPTCHRLPVLAGLPFPMCPKGHRTWPAPD